MTTTTTPAEVQTVRNSRRAGIVAAWIENSECFIPEPKVTDSGHVTYELHRGAASVLVTFEEAAGVTVQTGEFSVRNGRFYEQATAQFSGEFNTAGVIAYIDSLI